MRVLTVTGFLLLLNLCFGEFAFQLSKDDILIKFKEFKFNFSKVYQNQLEEDRRFEIFKSKLLFIEQHNARTDVSFKKGINQFSDMTHEEFLSLQTYRPSPGPGPMSQTFKMLPVSQLPEEVDWRSSGVITDVHNQGACGSCWAFATVAQIESYTALAGDGLPDLSVEQITACAPNPLTCGGSGGCLGSVEQLGYNYIQLFGAASDQSYPYVSGTGLIDYPACEYSLVSTPPVVSISGYSVLDSNNYQAVMNHLANVGPLAVAVAVGPDWEDYDLGVLSCGYNDNIGINHAVQLVGYGNDFYHGDYWLVRNSWGDSWGEDGYVRLSREDPDNCGSNNTPMDGTACTGGPGSQGQTVCGECGILFEATYPLGARKI